MSNIHDKAFTMVGAKNNNIDNLNKIIKEHTIDWENYHYQDLKIMEIMSLKVGLCIDSIDGIEGLQVQVQVLLKIKSFIDDLQKLENNGSNIEVG